MSARSFVSSLVIAGTIAIALSSAVSADPPEEHFVDQPDKKHSTLITHSGDPVRDDDLAGWIKALLIRGGSCYAKDAKFLFQECFGGGMLDDLRDALGAIVPWVGGSAARHDQKAVMEASTRELNAKLDEVVSGYPEAERAEKKQQLLDMLKEWRKKFIVDPPQSFWTKVLKVELNKAAQTLIDGINNTRANDEVGVNAPKAEHRMEEGQSIYRNGGDTITLKDPTAASHHAILWSGDPADADFEDVKDVRAALINQWGALGANVTVTVLFGDGAKKADGTNLPAGWNAQEATRANLQTAINNLTAKMNDTEQFFFYATDHGGTDTDIVKTPKSITAKSASVDPLDLFPGELQGMLQQSDNVPMLTVAYTGLPGSCASVLFNGLPLGALDPMMASMDFVVPEDIMDLYNEVVIFNDCDDPFTLDSLSFFTGGIDRHPPFPAIFEAKIAAEGTPIILIGRIVTAAFYDDDGMGGFEPSSFAVEAEDRSSGIRILSGAPVIPGDIVDIVGMTATVDGERVIVATSVTIMSMGNPMPHPFNISTLHSGGGEYFAQGAVVNDATQFPPVMACDMNSVGLLMTLTGRVTAASDTGAYDGYFYLDDAYGDAIWGFETGLKDGSGNIGVRCRPAADMVGFADILPVVDDFVEVTGVMGVTEINGLNARYLRTTSWQPATTTGVTSPLGTVVVAWNLLSVPYQPQDPNPAAVLSGIDIDAKLYGWDACTQSLLVYDMWMPNAFGPIWISDGYWLNSDFDETLSYTGYTDNGLDRWISLPAGWKIIGHPFDGTTPWADWNVANGVSTETIETARDNGSLESLGYWWNNSTQSLMTLGLWDDWPDTDQLDKWHGYWVQSYEDLGLIAPAASVVP